MLNKSQQQRNGNCKKKRFVIERRGNPVLRNPWQSRRQQTVGTDNRTLVVELQCYANQRKNIMRSVTSIRIKRHTSRHDVIFACPTARASACWVLFGPSLSHTCHSFSTVTYARCNLMKRESIHRHGHHVTPFEHRKLYGSLHFQRGILTTGLKFILNRLIYSF